MTIRKKLVHMPFGSMGQALSTYAGQNYGAGKTERIQEGFHQSMDDQFCILHDAVYELETQILKNDMM